MLLLADLISFWVGMSMQPDITYRADGHLWTEVQVEEAGHAFATCVGFALSTDGCCSPAYPEDFQHLLHSYCQAVFLRVFEELA